MSYPAPVKIACVWRIHRGFARSTFAETDRGMGYRAGRAAALPQLDCDMPAGGGF
jgi:hypothetical protein